MLLWGLFTVGYIVGVLFTLAILTRKKGRGEPLSDISYGGDSHQAVYESLTKINYGVSSE